MLQLLSAHKIGKTNGSVSARPNRTDLNQKFDALSRAAALIEFNPDGTVISVNENFEAAMGYKLEEIRGKHHRILCYPDYASSQEYAEHWAKLNRGIHFSGTVERVTRHGETIWLDAAYYPILGADGKVEKVFKIASDITERTAETHMQQCTIDALHKTMAVIEFELDGTIVTANENFLGATGYNLNEIVGDHHRIFCHSEFTDSPDYTDFWRRLGHGEFFSGKFKRKTKSGETLWIDASYNPISDVKGNLIRVIKFASDITEQVERSNEAQTTASRTSAETEKVAHEGTEIAASSKVLMGELSDNLTSASSTLEALNDQADQIKKIVETIAGIASQTNLLAINAAIEAARAGEHGSGFAVVADEVRGLAARTATSTSEIEQVVQTNLDLVDDATSAMEQSLNDLRSGVELNEKFSGVIEQISGEIGTVVESVKTLSTLNQSS